MSAPRTTTFTRVKVYTSGRDNKYGQTRQGIGVMKKITDAMRDGNTVSAREYIEGSEKFMDAEIIWDADQ